VTVAGDCSIAGLGMDLNDRQTLASNINIIFHAAATIKFDESLKLAVDINVHGTRDVMELAEETKNLKVSKSVKLSDLQLNGFVSFSPSFTSRQLTRIVI
jgi:thioester reductase-like protein